MPNRDEADVSNDKIGRATAWLEAWDAQGVHRTATEGDAAGALWLMNEALLLGAGPTIAEFALDRLDPIAAFLEIDGARIDGVPVFDAPSTDAHGIAGRIGQAGSAAPIGLVELSPHAVYAPEYEKLRRESRHDALVVVCKGIWPGIGLLNAERFRGPYGAPAIHVSSEARETIFAAAEREVEVRLVAESRRSAATARNVVVSIAGRAPQRPPVVVMTPRSSWWQSTAERGGGLVCWLETLRAVIAAPPGPDVVFTANSGHELGHLGLDAFLGRRPGWETNAVWVHYAPISAPTAASSQFCRRIPISLLSPRKH